MKAAVRVYGAKACLDTLRSVRFFQRNSISYIYFDVDDDAEALAYIKSVNNGNRTTPTIWFPDESILFEPTDEQLSRKLGVLK